MFVKSIIFAIAAFLAVANAQFGLPAGLPIGGEQQPALPEGLPALPGGAPGAEGAEGAPEAPAAESFRFNNVRSMRY